ncbi:hypothetical protein IWQ51_006267 [Labrenzia sp. EL_142]|nr:hypothetical protein [Labrenzia sp. EL_142]
MPRPWKPGKKITPDTLRDCLDILAKVIGRKAGEKYVPLYLRIERELEAMQEQQSAYQRILRRAECLERPEA